MATAKTQYALLGLLKTMGPQSGYQLKKTMSETTSHFWTEAFGSIYPCLQKMEKQGFIRKEGTAGTGKRETIIYAITSIGEDVLDRWLLEPPEELKGRNELLLKIFVSSEKHQQDVQRFIEHHRRKAEQKLQVFEEIERMLMREEKGNPSLKQWLMTLSYGKIFAKATIEWCDTCEF